MTKKEDSNIEIRIEKLNENLEKILGIYKENRKLALDNYYGFERQLDKILDEDIDMSEDGKVEKAKNDALKLVFESGKSLDKVLDTIAKLLITQLNNETREKVAGTLASLDGNTPLTKPVSIQQMLESKREEEA